MKNENKSRRKAGPQKGYRQKSLAFRKQVVEEYNSGEYRLIDLAEKYDVKPNTISNWKYQVAYREGGPDPLESSLDMQQIANEIILGLYTKEEAIVRYGFTKPLRLRYWVQKVHAQNFKDRKSGKIRNSPALGMNLTPKSSNKQPNPLEKALSDAQLRILALETLIEVAERDLGINIRKKPGTKQSKR